MAIETVTRTLLSSYIQSHLDLRLPFRPVDYTTLNQFLDIEEDNKPGPNDLHEWAMFVIGNGGHYNSVTENNVHVQVPRQQEPINFGLYNMIPQVLRELNNDVSVADRARLGLRKIITNPRDGKKYIAYYGRWFDKSQTVVKMIQYRIENGKRVDVSDFIPNQSNLKPTPPDLTNEGVNVVDGRFVRTTSVVDISFTPQDVEELRNASIILTGTEVEAFFTELGVVAAVPKTVQAQSSGTGSFSYREAIEAMVTNHMQVNYQALYFNQGFDLFLEFGSNEPLFRPKRVSTDGFGIRVPV